jgi:hypothetical protein
MSNILNAVPLVSMGVSLLTGLINKIDRGVNSCEHNCKKDLHKLLEPLLGRETADKIHDFLNTGKDQGLGDRMRALMSAGLIPPSLAPQIAQLAKQNCVPQCSIDQNALQRPMEEMHASQTMGEEQANKLGLGQFFDETRARQAESHRVHQKFLLQNFHPN